MSVYGHDPDCDCNACLKTHGEHQEACVCPTCRSLRMSEPLAPPWPTPMMELEEYTAFKAKWNAELKHLRSTAEYRLQTMTDKVRNECPWATISTTLFDIGSQVGIAAGIQGGKRFAVRAPIAGFNAEKLHEIVTVLGSKSASDAANGS